MRATALVVGATLATMLLAVTACGAPATRAEPTATPNPTAAPAAGQPAFHGTGEEVESLLSGRLLGRYRGLPADYRKALAAYLALGVSPDLMPELVEQKMAQWPSEPEPMSDLLGPEGYARFQNLSERGAKAQYYAFFLLSVYVSAHANSTEHTFEGRRQAVIELMDALDPRLPPVTVSPPPGETALTPGPLANMDAPTVDSRQQARFQWPPIERVLYTRRAGEARPAWSQAPAGHKVHLRN